MILRGYISLAFVLTCCLGLPLSSGAATRIVLATDDTPGPPYIIGGGTAFNQQKPGIEIELYQMVAARLDLQITFRRFSWIRCLNLLATGHVDGIFPASYKPERLKLGVYPLKNGLPDPDRKTRDNAYYLYKRKDAALQWDGRQITGLGGGAIGVPTGWAIAGDLKDMGIPVSDIRLPQNALKMLLHGRFPGLALLGTVADAYLQNTPGLSAAIVKLTPPLKSKAYYLMLSHQFVERHPRLAKKIWDTIAAVMQTQAYREVVAGY